MSAEVPKQYDIFHQVRDSELRASDSIQAHAYVSFSDPLVITQPSHETHCSHLSLAFEPAPLSAKPKRSLKHCTMVLIT